MTDLDAPRLPRVPDAQRANVRSRVRYEDVCQDGRVIPAALAAVLGPLWYELFAKRDVTFAAPGDGVLPILTRLQVVSTDARVPVGRPFEVEGAYDIANAVEDVRVAADANARARPMLNISAIVSGRSGLTYGTTPDQGAPVVVGHVRAEHVFTRPFAPRGQRRVDVADLRYDGPVTDTRWSPMQETLRAPDSPWTALDALDDAGRDVVFGLHHTDSNQHVNSLVYLRLFEDAVLHRFATHGLALQRLARAFEISYRKPCFAGQRARVLTQLHGREDALIATGCFVDPQRLRDEGLEAAMTHAYCYVRMRFFD